MKTKVWLLKSLFFCSITSISILGILTPPKLLAQDTNQVIKKHLPDSATNTNFNSSFRYGDNFKITTDTTTVDTTLNPTSDISGETTMPQNTKNVTGEDIRNSAEKNAPGLIPTDDPNQKWCEGYEVKDGTIEFKGVRMKKNGVYGIADIPVNLMNPGAIEEHAFGGSDFAKATNDNVTFFGQRKSPDGNTLWAYLIVRASKTDESIKSVATTVQIIELKLNEHDLKITGDIFFDTVFQNSAYISRNGNFLAASSQSVEIIEPNTWKTTTLTLSKLIGAAPEDVPDMVDPRIYEENGWYVIIDPIMKNGEGKQAKIIFKIYSEKDTFESIILDETELAPLE